MLPYCCFSAVHRRSCHNIASQRGTTLYEAIMTLAVTGIVTATAVPGMKHLLANQRQSTAMNGFVTALHATRSEAIKRRERAVLCPSSDNQTCQGAAGGSTEWHQGYLMFADRNASRTRDDEEPVLHVFTPPQGIRILSSAARDHVTYQATGLASGTNATFTFCTEKNVIAPRAVILSNSGRPRVAKASASSCPE
jgi:type IV fimbrial biogenesis protein FimT